jgi:DNA repair protein RadD
MADLKLYDHQEDLVSKIREAWTQYRRVMLWLPTGGGKTELSVALADLEHIRGGTVLFVVERKTLCAQAASRFRKYGHEPGILRGEDTSLSGFESVVVASVQTIASRRDHLYVQQALDRVSLVIIDEAHIRFGHHDELDQAMPNARILGLSATPLRDGLAKHYDTLVRGPSYGWMIENGYLIRPRYFLPHAEHLKGLSGVSVSSTGDYVNAELSALMRKKTIIGDVVSTWQEKAEGRPTICFCVDIAHSKDTCDAFNLAGVRAEHIDKSTPEDERRAMFARFRDGETKVLCSIVVLAIGFDEPGASCAILARPTLSLALHIQQIGRVMRTHPRKADCLVLDHAGNVLRHGKVEDFVPPELSEIDKTSDKRKKSDEISDYYPCPECRAIMSPGQRVCTECGHEIARKSQVDFIPGELTEDPNEPIAPTPEEQMKELYLQLMGYARDYGHQPGWAFYRLKEYRNFKAPFAWKYEKPKPPTPATLRLIKSWNIAYRKARQKAEGKVRQLRPVCDCGSTATYQTEGTGPHAAALRCVNCDKFLRWLPKEPSEGNSREERR